MEKAFSDSDLQRIVDQHKTPQRHLKHEWQAFAFKVFKDLHGKPEELPQFISLFKRYNLTDRRHLEHAYSFLRDYEGYVPKIKMFYWAFWQFKRNNGVIKNK